MSFKEPLTEELLGKILESDSIEDLSVPKAYSGRTLAEYLCELLEIKRKKRVDVIREAGIDATFGYQIFKGQRNPSRDKVLSLCLALNCTLRETNRALKISGANELYSKNRRDVIIIFAIEHNFSFQRTNEALYEFEEPTLN